MQKYRFHPKELPEPPPAPRKPFDAIDAVLQLRHTPSAITLPRRLDEPLLQVLEGACAADTAPGRLRAELAQLVHCSDGEAAAVEAGFVSLRDLMGAAIPDSSGIDRHLAALGLEQAPAAQPPAAPCLPDFLLHTTQQPQASSGAPASTHLSARAPLFKLALPVLLPAEAKHSASPALGAPISAFGCLFQPLPVPEVRVDNRFAPTSCQPVTLASLLAQDLVLNDRGLVLPAVEVDGSSGEAESGADVGLPDNRASHLAALLPAVTAWPPLAHRDRAVSIHLVRVRRKAGAHRAPGAVPRLVGACRPRCQVPAAHCGRFVPVLRASWGSCTARASCPLRSLATSQPASRPAELTVAVARMRQRLLPAALPPAVDTGAGGRYRATLVHQLVAPFQARVAPARPVTCPAQPLPAAAAAMLHASQLPPAGAPAGALRDTADAAQAIKRPKRSGAAEGMRFFLQLQHGSAQAAVAGTAAPSMGAESADAVLGASSSSSGEMADALEVHARKPSTAVHSIELPPAHAELLRLLRDDEQRLVRLAPKPGVASEVARSDFLSVDVLRLALEQLAGRWRKDGRGRMAAQAPDRSSITAWIVSCRQASTARPGEGVCRHGR